MKKKAIVFGSTGQMGSYLCEFLLSKGYDVRGPLRSGWDFEQITSPSQFEFLLDTEKPDEIYNMAGLNFAADSWMAPTRYMQVNGTIVLTLLQAIKEICPKAKFFQASSAEIFSKHISFQSEISLTEPENPYGLAKKLATDLVKVYRDKYGMYACSGIFFNAESPRRGKFFFAEKVAHEVVKLKMHLENNLPYFIEFGKLSARRDWGWAPEYVEVAWKMLQMPRPEDFVIGTGESHTCLAFVREAFKVAGIKEEDMDAYLSYENKIPDFSAITQEDIMQAIPTKAEKLLGWKAKYKFKDVVRMLVEAEMKVQLGQSVTTG